MSRTTTQAATKRSATSHLFGPARGKTTSRITSDTIAEDIAAFKKNGGRIEVLGNTPPRPRVQGSAFRSKTTKRATRAPAAKKAAKS